MVDEEPQSLGHVLPAWRDVWGRYYTLKGEKGRRAQREVLGEILGKGPLAWR